MRNGQRVFDVDRHVLEPVAMWRDYLPAAMQAWAPALQPFASDPETLHARLARLGTQALLPTPPMLAVQGRPIYRGMSEAAYIELGAAALQRRDSLAASATGPGQLATMDATGVDVAILLPTYASYLVWHEAHSALVSRSYADAYNRWLLDVCAADRRRLKPAVVVSCHEPERLVQDLEQALVAEPVAVVLRPNPIHGRTLSHPAYARFWQACASNALPVLLHEGTHAHTATIGADRFASRFGQHACSHPLEAMMALLSLIEGGVLEQNPGLRVAILEAGCGWLPYWLWRLDEVEYRPLRQEVATCVRRAPSDYFRAQCWIAAELGEPLLDRVVAHLGRDKILLGTDFPHLDHALLDVDGVLAAPGLDAADVHAIAWENAARLFRCKEPLTV
jgi:uncharacterized protein